MSTELCVRALTDIPALLSLCKEQEILMNRTLQIQFIDLLLNGLGPHFSYKVIQHMLKKRVYNWSDEDFEVEEILDSCREKGEDFFLVKWNGWSCSFNSWERSTNLKCQELLEAFKHRKQTLRRVEVTSDTREVQLKTILDYLSKRYDEKLLDEIMKAIDEMKWLGKIFRIRRTKYAIGRKLNKNSNLYKAHKAELKNTLLSWEASLNPIDSSSGHIYVENKVDLEAPPTDFVYITSCIADNNVIVDKIPNSGCKCAGGTCFANKKSCCGELAGYEFAYTKQKRLVLSEGRAIYECNNNCLCDETCPNRVVQLGRKVPLCLFRTKDAKGWGVKAVHRIPKGTFVEEYVGEIITSDEAERRGKVYDTEGLTYLFDLDFHESDCAFTIDAKNSGNISHFINHSCDPNLAVFNVWIDNSDQRLPRIALFAIKNINPNEELTFDYKINISNMVTDEDSQEMVDTIEDVPPDVYDGVLNVPICCTPVSRDLEVKGDSEVTLESNDASDAVESRDTKSDLNVMKTVQMDYTSLENSSKYHIKECYIIPNLPPETLRMKSRRDPEFRSDSPSSNSLSVPDLASFGENSASENSGRSSRMILRSRKKPHHLKTECWVKSGGTTYHSPGPKMPTTGRSKATTNRALASPGEGSTAPKRMRIVCNCRSKNCRQWLC